MKNIEIGDRVKIYRYCDRYIWGKGIKRITEQLIYGKVIDKYWSDDLSYHGSSHYEQIYVVIGDDDRKYEVSYGRDYRSSDPYGVGYDISEYIIEVIQN